MLRLLYQIFTFIHQFISDDFFKKFHKDIFFCHDQMVQFLKWVFEGQKIVREGSIVHGLVGIRFEHHI